MNPGEGTLTCDACKRLFDASQDRRALLGDRTGITVPVCPDCSCLLDAALPPQVLAALGRPRVRRGKGPCGVCGRRFRLSKSRGTLIGPEGPQHVCPTCSDAFDHHAQALAAEAASVVRA